jgi:hypothetical protein
VQALRASLHFAAPDDPRIPITTTNSQRQPATERVSGGRDLPEARLMRKLKFNSKALEAASSAMFAIWKGCESEAHALAQSACMLERSWSRLQFLTLLCIKSEKHIWPLPCNRLSGMLS